MGSDNHGPVKSPTFYGNRGSQHEIDAIPVIEYLPEQDLEKIFLNYPKHRVIVWDCQKSRIALIDRIIAKCGAKSILLKGFADLDLVKCSYSCCFAIIALGASPLEDPDALKMIHHLNSNGFIVISHGHGSSSWDLAMRSQALLAGASFVLDSGKPGFAQELERLLADLFLKRQSELKEENEIKNLMSSFGMVGESNAILSIFRQILKISPLCRLPVLVTGETGTGKDLIARAIHQLDPERSKGPFVVVNCGAINSNLAESELFGHKKGAFTGAEKERKGLFRSAHNGVLFLDEIGELTSGLQAKLLRVLQEDRVLSVGYDQEFQVNYRIIAATNRNLTEMMERGEFRSDLFHRLNVLTIHVPPLRERKTDIDPLIFYFLDKYRSISSSKFSSVSRDFLEALSQLEFSGNVRQLENIVLRTLVNKKDNVPLSMNDLPPEVWQQLCLDGVHDTKQIESSCRESSAIILSKQTPLKQLTFSDVGGLIAANKWNLSQFLNYCEKLLIKAALHQAQGNQSRTAQLLGITPRSIYNKLRKHQLNH